MTIQPLRDIKARIHGASMDAIINQYFLYHHACMLVIMELISIYKFHFPSSTQQHKKRKLQQDLFVEFRQSIHQNT